MGKKFSRSCEMFAKRDENFKMKRIPNIKQESDGGW